MNARGTFDVTVTPQPGAVAAESEVGLMSIDKQFHGDIEGVSQGAMLAAMTSVSGSAGYVAIERVTGTLNGRRGSFVLQHRGIMNRGVQELSIAVIPDSGTDDLVGLAGAMTLIIADGMHSYDFEYTLPASH